MYWAAIAIITSLCLAGLNQSDNANFGPYRTTWRSYETCKGPKQGDCGNVKIGNTQNMTDVIFYMDIQKECPVTKARVTAGSVQKNNYTKKLWNYALEKPCQHFVLGPIIVDAYNLSSTCKIKKHLLETGLKQWIKHRKEPYKDSGQYTVHINMQEKFTTFLGPNFFYGIYMFKLVAFNNVNNFLCIKTELEAGKM